MEHATAGHGEVGQGVVALVVGHVTVYGQLQHVEVLQLVH